MYQSSFFEYSERNLIIKIPKKLYSKWSFIILNLTTIDNYVILNVKFVGRYICTSTIHVLVYCSRCCIGSVNSLYDCIVDIVNLWRCLLISTVKRF